MTKNELLVKVAAALTTLAETNGAPESVLYLGLCNMNMSEWETLRHILLQGDFVSISGNYVSLTQTGKETAEKLESVIRK